MANTSMPTATPAGPRYYHAADAVGRELYVWLPLVGGSGALVLGLVYAFIAYLLHVIDEAPWLVAVTPFFGAALAYLARYVSQLGKVRKRKFRRPVAYCVAAVGFYASWHAYLNFARSDHPGIFDPAPTWHMSPPKLLGAMRDLADDRGFSSWLLWLVEAVTVFGFIPFTLDEDDPEIPFCEKCGKWTSEAFSLNLGDTTSGSIADQFKNGDVEGLHQLGPWKSSLRRYVRLRVFRCPCSLSCFACLDEATITPGKKGSVDFRRRMPGGRQHLILDPGTAKTTQFSPLVTNLEIDGAFQTKLEAFRSEMLKAK